MSGRFLGFFADIFETIIIALAVFLLTYFFLIQPHRVQGDSMLPNFTNGELILTDKISYKIHTPGRGDVVVFKAPVDQSKDFIKRIIGLPGEKVELVNNQVYLNGQPLSEKYLESGTKTAPGAFLQEGRKLTIPQEDYLVMGDNRNHSSDSREWGTVPKSSIVGKAFIIYWPPPSFALVPHVQY